MQGQHANCTYEKVYSKGIIKRINDATLLINDAISELTSNCSNSSQTINGSLLIQFENCAIYLDGEPYVNLETVIPRTSYYPTTGLIARETDVLDIPPNEYLQNLTLEHRSTLDTLRLQNHSLSFKLHLFGSLGTTFITLTIIAMIVFIYLSRRSNTNIKISIPLEEQEMKEVTHVTIPDEPKDDEAEEKKKFDTFFNIATPFRTTNKS